MNVGAEACGGGYKAASVDAGMDDTYGSGASDAGAGSGGGSMADENVGCSVGAAALDATAGSACGKKVGVGIDKRTRFNGGELPAVRGEVVDIAHTPEGPIGGEGRRLSRRICARVNERALTVNRHLT